MPEIGNLLVSLQMETASFNKGLADANKRLDGFASQFSAIGKNIQSTVGGLARAFHALAGSAAIAAIGGWAKGMADAGEATTNLANAMGLTLAEVVSLQGVFQLTTGTLGEASGAMRIFIGHIAEAIAKAGPARENFAALGITLADLQAKGRNPLEMLKLVADRLKGFENDTVKAAVSADLFGKGWEKISPILQEGSAGIERLAAQARELDPSAQAAAEAGSKLDNELDTLRKSVIGLSNEGFVILNPLLIDGAQGMTTLASDTRKAIAALNDATQAVGGLVGILSALATSLPIIGQVVALKGMTEDAAKAARDFLKPPVATAELPPVSVTAPAPSAVKKMIAPGGGGGKKKGGGGKDELDALARAAERELKRRQREAIEAQEELNKLSDEKFRRDEQALKHQFDMDRLSKQELITAERKLLDEKMIATQGFYQKKLEAAKADEDETRKLQSQSKLDYERFLTEREALNQEAAKDMHSKFKDVFTDIGSAFKTSFENIFESLLAGTFKLRDAIGSLLKDIGKKLASKGMDALFDIGGKALGKVFSSSTFSFPGLQAGGSFQVGGAGALDSQLVAFRASPGEMVNVNRPGETRGVGETIRIDLNPSEGWVAGVADQRIVTRSGQIIEVAVRQSSRTVQRNFAGMSAEAQARQL